MRSLRLPEPFEGWWQSLREPLQAWTRRLRPSPRQPAPKAHVGWRFVFPAVVVAAALAVVLLAREGGRAVLNEQYVSIEETIVLQPDEPGYLELVGVTPTLLSLHLDGAELAGVAFLARTGIDAGGGVVLLPADLIAEAEQGETLAQTYAAGGADAVEQVAERLFGIGFDDVINLPTARLAQAMAPAEPLPYLLVDELRGVGADGASRVLYEAGRLELSAADAAAIYGLRNAGEADVNRLQRQKALWESWIAVVGRADDPVAVSPQSAPLSEFLPALAGATAVVEVPPLQSVAVDTGSPSRYTLGSQGQAWLRDEVLELVPRPRQPESFLRPRVQLLDATGDPEARDAMVDEILAAGGVVTVIGNAAEFGAPTTTFAYHRPELVQDPITNSIAIRLGVDMALIELGEGTPEVVDITVTVGHDLAAR